MKVRKQGIMSDINITPLTDIFLVLLIIMMVVAPMLDYRGLDMAISVGDASEVSKDAKNVVVSVAADGRYKIDGEDVEYDHLLTTVRTLSETKKDGVVIEVDPESSHAALAHAIDSVQGAGIANVSVVEGPDAAQDVQDKPTQEGSPDKKKEG